MKISLLFFTAALVGAIAASVRENNGGNCIGVRSCRPRCISFKIDRDTTGGCSRRAGIFDLHSEINPWDIKRFAAYTCDADDGTCSDENCGESLPEDLAIRIGEEGYAGSYRYTTIHLTKEDDAFTFCSIYPCPKDECALPEQMGFELQIDIADSGNTNSSSIGKNVSGARLESFLRLEFYLKAAFVGPVLMNNTSNYFGPLHVLWVDDPTGCRTGSFSEYAPVAPPPASTSATSSSLSDSNLYCSGKEYEPAPLPVAITGSPTSIPTSIPTNKLAQLDALRDFFYSVRMNSSVARPLHNWFLSNDDDYHDYCTFTGLSCDSKGYVTGINLVAKALSGSIPTSIDKFTRLRRLNVEQNSIGGTIPESLFNATLLTQLELSNNRLEGSLPQDVWSLGKAKRIMLSNNFLTGTLPPSICGQWQTLLAFDVSGNSGMHGELPSCFGQMNLKTLRIDNIGLVGTVPQGLCGIREMNGLRPNTFGCDAIACPSGTYQPNKGRQTSNETACLKCSVFSNVIGSRTCLFLEGNTLATLAPTQSLRPIMLSSVPPSIRPSLLPSEFPSLLPSLQPTRPPSVRPSMMPSSLSSGIPSMLDVTTGPSVSSTISPSQVPMSNSTEMPTSPSSQPLSVIFSIAFLDVSALLEEFDDILTFQNVTQRFIQDTLSDSTNVGSISSVNLLSQHLKIPTNQTIHVAVTNPQLRLRRRLYRSLEELTEVLVTELKVAGTLSAENPQLSLSFSDTVLSVFKNNMTAYVKALSNALDLFVTPIPSESTARGFEDGAIFENIKHVNELYISLSFIFAFILAVALFMWLSRWHKFHKKGTQDKSDFLPEGCPEISRSLTPIAEESSTSDIASNKALLPCEEEAHWNELGLTVPVQQARIDVPDNEATVGIPIDTNIPFQQPGSHRMMEASEHLSSFDTSEDEDNSVDLSYSESDGGSWDDANEQKKNWYTKTAPPNEDDDTTFVHTNIHENQERKPRQKKKKPLVRGFKYYF